MKKKKHKTMHLKDIKVPKISNPNLSDFEEHKSSLDFSNPKLVQKILMQHFIDGEHETFFEILALYMDKAGKSNISRSTEIPERTIYNFIKGDHRTSSVNIFKVMKFISEEVEKKSA